MGKLASTIGTLALTWAGSALGGTVGAAVGTMIGGMLFGQPQQTGASSTSDLKAQVAEPSFLKILCGGDIPDVEIEGRMLDGGVTTAGIVIAVSPNGGITRVAKKSKSGGGGGTGGRLFGSQGPTNYDHFLSMAVAWCEGSTEHPKKLMELRADEKLYFLASAAADEEGYIEMTEALDVLGNPYASVSTNFRHYYGTATQLPDDVVQTWFDGSAAPAFRNCCYSAILNYQIDEFGHIPLFTARISDGVTERWEQCKVFLLRSNGIDGEEVLPPERLHLDAITGHSRGWFMSQPGATRDTAEWIAKRAFCRLTEHSGGIYAVDMTNPTIVDLTLDELDTQLITGDDTNDAPTDSTRSLAEELSMVTKVQCTFSDSGKGFDENTVTAQIDTALQENLETYDIPTVDEETEMQAWAEAILDAAWVGRLTVEVSLPTSRIDLVPGDVIRVPKRKSPGSFYEAMIQTATLGTPGPLQISAQGWSAETWFNRPRTTPTVRPDTTLTWAAPKLFISSPVALSMTDPDTYSMPVTFAAATQTSAHNWEKGAFVSYDRSTGGGDWDEMSGMFYPLRATMGELAVDWTPGAVEEFDYDGSGMGVQMFFGDLASSTEALVRAGANKILFESGVVVSFVTATQATDDGFVLKGTRPGDWGSDDLLPADGVMPAGSRFVLLTDANAALQLAVVCTQWSGNYKGKLLRLRGRFDGRADTTTTTREFSPTYANVYPPSPVGVRATRAGDGALRLRGRGRTRILDDSAWDLPINGRMSETPGRSGFAYTVALTADAVTKTVTKYSEDDLATFDWTWSAAELTTLFGSLPGTLSGTIALAGTYGLGFPRAWSEE